MNFDLTGPPTCRVDRTRARDKADAFSKRVGASADTQGTKDTDTQTRRNKIHRHA